MWPHAALCCQRLQVCTEDGTVFDITNIVPYVQKFGKHPVTGEPLKVGTTPWLRPLVAQHGGGNYRRPHLHAFIGCEDHCVPVSEQRDGDKANSHDA